MSAARWWRGRRGRHRRSEYSRVISRVWLWRGRALVGSTRSSCSRLKWVTQQNAEPRAVTHRNAERRAARARKLARPRPREPAAWPPSREPAACGSRGEDRHYRTRQKIKERARRISYCNLRVERSNASYLRYFYWGIYKPAGRRTPHCTTAFPSCFQFCQLQLELWSTVRSAVPCRGAWTVRAVCARPGWCRSHQSGKVGPDQSRADGSPAAAWHHGMAAEPIAKPVHRLHARVPAHCWLIAWSTLACRPQCNAVK